MKLAVMQPYFFPYVGYFQLIRAVDAFVVLDDVNYIVRGWVNRNYILGPNGKHLLTLPLKGASQNQLINEVEVQDERHKLLKTLHHAYRRAPLFDAVFPVLEEILSFPEPNLSRFLTHGLKQICGYLDLHPMWQTSSQVEKPPDLRGQDRILALCETLGATHYINAPGGRSLYEPGAFHARGMELSFLDPDPPPYTQFGAPFTPNLSIIDVMMFNTRDQLRVLLDAWRLSEASGPEDATERGELDATPGREG